MPGELSGKAAIAGIGATDFSKDSGRSELRLAAEAVGAALDDAGLTPADVDGMVTFTMDSNTEAAVARAAGIGELKFFSKIHHGGGAACATVQQAAIAVATGVADCVVAYRAFNERSGMRFGQVQLDLARIKLALMEAPKGTKTAAGGAGRAGRPPLHAPAGRHQPGLRRGLGGRSPACGQQPQRVLLRQADHHRGSSELAVDR